MNTVMSGKQSIFGKDSGARAQKSLMSAAGQHVLSGYGGSLTSSASKNARSFHASLIDIEEEIAETRKELNFCRKEIQILNSERDTVLEMADTKCSDINKYLTKEMGYLEELIQKSMMKQKAENSRF